MVRERITISVDEDVIKWLDKMIQGGQFFNRSHGLEFLAKRAMARQARGGKPSKDDLRIGSSIDV